ncbi:MAG: hypothetical protein Tsb0021_14430 [Chlamydiales bacterium]
MGEMEKKQEPTFEENVSRIEEIVEKMNSGNLSLDDSLHLFEEANRLIIACNKRLTDAEKKIEILIKNREGELEYDANGNPVVEEFKRDG